MDPSPDKIAQVERARPRQRLLVIAVGIILMACGVVAAFTDGSDGVTVAALLATGFAVTFVGYLGQYITSIKYREFEARLQAGVQQIQQGVQQMEAQVELVKQKTQEVMTTLDEAGRAYQTIRSQMVPGGERDIAMSEGLETAMGAARANPPEPERVRALCMSDDEGDRIEALAAMKANPELWDFECVVHAISHPHGGFDQDRFLVLAADMLHRVSPAEGERLREVVEEQRLHGEISRQRIRWLSAERLLRLMER